MKWLLIASFALSACGSGAPSTRDDGADDARTPAWSADPADEAARYNEYLDQAGITDPAGLLSEKEVQACDVLAHQGAVTFDSGVTKSCTWQQSEPGWVIESVRIDVLENTHKRGSYTESILAAEGQIDINVPAVGDKWTLAIDLAGKAGDADVEAKLALGYQQYMDRVETLSVKDNSVYLQVTADGGLFQSSTIHVIAYAKLLRVQ